ncbi:chaplin [Streptomyces sp. NPDC002896]|uniref:chaplin n=1 Tax=Streptomyces sp. NPDC002896 TaxID=3154438 RepID=UPI00331D8B88
MKRVARNGLIAVAVAGGAMASVGAAYADAGASGSTTGSPGVISGNTVQIPVHVPLNVCGNTVNVVGVLNPAADNTCTNGAGQSGGGAIAQGQAQDSPGVVSGNVVQVPIDVPVNATGNSVNVVGIGNAATGNESSNGSDSGSDSVSEPVAEPANPPVTCGDGSSVSCGNDQPQSPTPVSVPDEDGTPETVASPDGGDESQLVSAGHPLGNSAGTLAQTGANPLILAFPAGLALLGGTILYRRFRPASLA